MITKQGKKAESPLSCCYWCGDKLELRRTDETRRYQQRILVIKNIPTWVCKKCGESIFESHVLTQVDKMIASATGKHIEFSILNYNKFTKVAT